MRWVRALAAAGLVAGCTAAPPTEPGATRPGTTRPGATGSVPVRPVPTAPLPVAEPGRLALGEVEIGRPVTAEVLVRPARTPVTLGDTELRGGDTWELTGDDCSGRRLEPTGQGCRLRVTVLARGTGELAARLVLPHDRGTLTVPVTAVVPLSYTVVVTVRGTGSVTGDRAGLSCSASCTARVPQGVLLTLTASAGVRWGGDCAGTDPVCRVPVDTPLEITASFGS